MLIMNIIQTMYRKQARLKIGFLETTATKNCINVPVTSTVCPSAYNNLGTAEQFLIKFDTTNMLV
jgi:hypothetical protein